MIIGIDPGISGAIVLLNEVGGFIAAMRTPTIKIGTKNRVNAAAIHRFITDHLLARSESPADCHAYIEKVQAMPGGGRKQGAASMFTFGLAAGIVEGLVAGMGMPMTLVTPQSWKKSQGLIGTEKDAARSRAIQLYPSCRDLDQIGKGQAVADAILIARSGIGLVGYQRLSEGDANA